MHKLMEHLGTTQFIIIRQKQRRFRNMAGIGQIHNIQQAHYDTYAAKVEFIIKCKVYFS